MPIVNRVTYKLKTVNVSEIITAKIDTDTLSTISIKSSGSDGDAGTEPREQSLTDVVAEIDLTQIVDKSEGTTINDSDLSGAKAALETAANTLETEASELLQESAITIDMTSILEDTNAL